MDLDIDGLLTLASVLPRIETSAAERNEHDDAHNIDVIRTIDLVFEFARIPCGDEFVTAYTEVVTRRSVK